jgi:hypothetical protein
MGLLGLLLALPSFHRNLPLINPTTYKLRNTEKVILDPLQREKRCGLQSPTTF